jgi:hypothetical protein
MTTNKTYTNSDEWCPNNFYEDPSGYARCGCCNKLVEPYIEKTFSKVAKLPPKSRGIGLNGEDSD